MNRPPPSTRSGVGRRALRVALLARSAELHDPERSLCRLAVGFAQWPEFQPLVIVPGDGALRERCRDHGVDTAMVEHCPWQQTQGSHRANWTRHAGNLRVWPRLLRRLERFSPDVILSSTAHVTLGALAAHRLGVAHGWRLHEIHFAEQRSTSDPGWWLTRSFLRARRNRLVAASAAVRDDFRRCLGRNDIVAIHDGFDFPPVPEGVGRHPPRRAGPSASAPLELLCAGSLVAGQGFEDALRAAADLIHCGQPVRLRVAGEGDLACLAGLRTRARRLRIADHVIFSGTGTDRAALYRRAEITLVCGHNEGFGRTAVESLAHGTPVIAADAGGLPEIVRPGRTGLLYPAGDWRALRDRIDTLIADDQLYDRIASTGLAWVRQRFGARRFIREMGEVLTRAAVQDRPELRHQLSSEVQPLPYAPRSRLLS